MNNDIFTFKLTSDHIALLRRANIRWQDDEFGAPEIDPKRPYGNSSVYADIGEILGIEEDEATEEFTPEQVKKMQTLHEETMTALEIFLQNAEMKPGTFEADRYERQWKAKS